MKRITAVALMLLLAITLTGCAGVECSYRSHNGCQTRAPMRKLRCVPRTAGCEYCGVCGLLIRRAGQRCRG